MPKFKLKYLSGLDGEKCRINSFPNFHYTGSISGMKKQYYGESALLVKCGSYIFNVTSEPRIYHNIAKDKPYETK